MTTAESPTTDWLSRRRTYRRLMFGAVVVGAGLNILLRTLEYPIVGEVVYWVGIVAFLGIWKGTRTNLVDERDRELERRAGMTALSVVAAVGIVGASTARLLPQLTDYTVPAVVRGALYGYIGLFIVFGVAYLWHRARL